MPWDPQVPSLMMGAFFCSHPGEEERAFEWLGDLRRRGVGWQAARQQIKDYMLRDTGGKMVNAEHREHVERELSRAEKMLRPWLVD